MAPSTVIPKNWKDFLCESELTSLAPCSHEEADTRMLLRVADAVQKGMRKVAIRTVDTDVVVLAVVSFNSINPDELGTGSSFRYIAVHQLAAAMTQDNVLLSPSSMPSQGATLCLHSLAEGRN